MIEMDLPWAKTKGQWSSLESSGAPFIQATDPVVLTTAGNTPLAAL